MTLDLDASLALLRTCKYLPEADMTALCARVKALLLEESNIQPVQSPVTVCGDIHGQFWDLLELLRVGGEPPETGYVFMVSAACPCELAMLASLHKVWAPSSVQKGARRSGGRARVEEWGREEA
jgi:hypothetical protein